jgi:DNA-directed RNA polymerase specialized sigma24 family protein
MSMPAAASAAKFPTTQWTDLISLQDTDASQVRDRIVRTLCKNYWFPLYAFARHRGLQRPDAEDAVQSFFLATGDSRFFQKADQQKGRFRTFLLTAFTRLLSSRTTHNNAQKRGGNLPHFSIDADQAEAWLLADTQANAEDSTLAFERHWAKNIIRSVLATLSAEAALTPKSASRFQILSRFLSPENCLGYTVRQAAADLDISLATCEKSIQRLRHQFRQAVRYEVASTLRNPTESSITEEMIQLQKSLIDP